MNKEIEPDNKIEMAKKASPAPDGFSFVTTPNEHERDARAISTERKSISVEQRRCIYCGQVAPLVWVHGHGQCASCGINVNECCRGESCFNNKE